MNRATEIYSGFVGRNTGFIRDCFADAVVHGRADRSGFVGENSRQIAECLYRSRDKNDIFCADNKGDISNIYRCEKNGEFTLFENTILNKKESRLCDPDDFRLDTRLWERSEESFRLKRDIKDKSMAKKDMITVTNADQLFQIAKSINEGREEAAQANYRLSNSIDLKGRKWMPIGSAENPFRGVFDGCGYSITNMNVNDKDLTYAGFFGVINGAKVMNLKVSGAVKNSLNGAIMAGKNHNGTFMFCHAEGTVRCKRISSGFAAINNGGILGSSFSGLIKPYQLAVPFSMTAAAALIFAAIMVISSNYNNSAIALDPPLRMDPNQQQDQSDTDKPREDSNQLSYNFSKVVSFNGTTGKFHLKNSGYSNHIIAVEIQITDAELLKTIGKTGRTGKDIERIEKAEDYNPETSRMTIARTGGVEPGYYLTSFDMQEFPDGSYLPEGSYEGIAVLKVYDALTHELSVINNELSITIEVN